MRSIQKSLKFNLVSGYRVSPFLYRSMSSSEATGKRNADEHEKCDATKIGLNPYLFFNGNARDAVNFYREVFDAKIEMMKTFEDGPPGVEEDWKDKIMHASLQVGGQSIMISDGKRHNEIKVGDNIHLSISMGDEEKLRAAFDAMAGNGGNVTMPLAKQFWGSLFGSVVDQFGVNWMFSGNYDEDKSHGKKAKTEA